MLIKPRRILELGTFTGYSALCLVEGLSPSAPFSSLVTVDKDQKATSIAKRYFHKLSFNQVSLLTFFPFKHLIIINIHTYLSNIRLI